jgi:hypothetical protein
MDPQTLVRELEQLKTGEPESEFRFLSILAGSSAFLLTDNEVSEEASGSVTVRVYIVRRDGYSSACLFSSVEELRGWCARRGLAAHWMSVCGADLAVALPSDTWIEIDPDTTRSVTLSPAHLGLLSAQVVPASIPQEVGSDSTSPDDGFEMVDSGPTQVAQPYRVAEGPKVMPSASETQSTTGGTTPPKRRFNRSNPTTLFEAPQLERKAEMDRPRTYTSSNLKKVIRPPKPGGEEE